jgi:hypothetical protein
MQIMPIDGMYLNFSRLAASSGGNPAAKVKSQGKGVESEI